MAQPRSWAGTRCLTESTSKLCGSNLNLTPLVDVLVCCVVLQLRIVVVLVFLSAAVLAVMLAVTLVVVDFRKLRLNRSPL